MWKWTLLLSLVACALPSFAARRVTVDQLEQVISTSQATPDAELARQLSELELTERLSMVRLAQWTAKTRGPKARPALMALADLSAFLGPPPAEIPAMAAPDLAAQRRMMGLTVDYVTKTIHQLPNLSTTRVTTGFQDKPWRRTDAQPGAASHEPLHLVGTYSATVLYRNGEEVVRPSAAKSEAAPQGLTTSGEFGPILGTAMLDAARSKLAWSHWEQGASGVIAVYRYAVPADRSHYEVKYCCIMRDTGDRIYFQQFTGYQGEIAVDPSSGTIVRLTLRADLKPTDPLIRADILVEYGPVEIGGKMYTCPVRGVALLVGLELQTSARQGAEDSLRPLQTSLNDVAFSQYHVFRAETRMLAAGDAEEPALTLPAGDVLTETTTHSEATAAEKPAEASLATPTSVAAQPMTAAAQPMTAAAQPMTAAAQPMTAAAQPTTAAPAPNVELPEMSVTPATSLPEMPALSSDKALTLRVTTRLVVVGLVALDKKGHPVTDLRPEEIELYDNGRKQLVQFIHQASGEGSSAPDHAPERVLDPPVFSNSRAALASANGAVESNVTILLIDAGNLAWADLTYARREMLRFLQALPAPERVGLYVMQAHDFSVLEEATADHVLLASKLRQWMPSAQDLARAQEMEQRNRQQFDQVRNPSDMQYVNGSMSSAPDTGSSVDPTLRDDGSHSGRDALVLPILAGVARHLAVISGHKNLVWVTSDNALADWTDKAVSSDKGAKHIDGLVLRTQEALNDADASVYPLDASQLETMAVDAGLENKSVTLDPGASSAPAAQGGAEKTGRISAEMQQDIHPIDGPMQQMAQATGGRAFRRAGDISAELSHVLADGRATYLLSFTPDVPADGEYHRLVVKLTNRRGVTLRYRSGYQYAVQPSTLKERFRQAVWQPLDVNEIAISGSPIDGTTLRLNIATQDLDLKQQERWYDTLAIFLIERDDEGLHAHITGQTLNLALKPTTYTELRTKGIPFDQLVGQSEQAKPLRIIVIDQHSGRMGSVTVPAIAWQMRR